MVKPILAFTLMSSIAFAWAMPASATSPFIYRYKAGIVNETVDTGNPGTSNPTDPGFPTTGDPVSCGTNNATSYGCIDGTAEPSDTGADPIDIVLTGNPDPGGDKPLQCVHVSGGYGNYVVWAYATGDASWIDSIDVVPRSNLGAADSGNTGMYFQYPGYDDDYDFLTDTSDLCVRITPKPGITGSPGKISVNFTVGDYTSDVVEGDKVNYNDNTYDQTKSVTFTLRGGLFGVPQSAIGVNFEYFRNNGYNRYYGPAYFAYSSATGSNVLRQSNFYYQCWTYNGGEPGNSNRMQYMVTKYIFEDVPSWVEWFDVRPPSQINLPYEPLPADHPGSQDGSWPMDFPYDQQHIFETTSKEICIRIKEKAGNISTQPFRFGIYMMQNFPIVGGTATDPLDQNYLNFEYTATPVFNDPANDTSPGGDDGDDGGGADTGDGAPS